MTGDAATGGALLRTALYDRHLAADARMVDFGGWDMPIQYKTGIRAEHLAVRSGVGVFDLSHMGRLYVRGADALALVQWLATNDASRLGGRPSAVLADLRRARARSWTTSSSTTSATQMLLVVNASNRLKILAWIDEKQRAGRWPASTPRSTTPPSRRR